MIVDIYGIILLGGKSSRMGKDKKYLLHKNKTFLETTILLLKNLKCNKLILSGTVSINSYKQEANIIVIPDITPNCGPLGGIHTVLKNCVNNKWLLFVPIDMPLLNQQIINYLLSPLNTGNITNTLIYFKDFIFPFLLKNTDNVYSLVKKQLDNNTLSLKNLFNLLNAFILCPPPTLKSTLTNINTIKDYLKI